MRTIPPNTWLALAIVWSSKAVRSRAHCAAVATSAKATPGQKISGGEPTGRRKRLTSRRRLPADARIDQNHRRGGRGHHADHHHHPHRKHVNELDGLPRGERGRHDPHAGGNHPKTGHLHSAHVHVCSKPQHISPCERG